MLKLYYIRLGCANFNSARQSQINPPRQPFPMGNGLPRLDLYASMWLCLAELKFAQPKRAQYPDFKRNDELQPEKFIILDRA